MNVMRATGLLLGIGAVITLTGCGDFFDGPQALPPPPPGQIFVMTAGSGTMAHDPHAGQEPDGVHFVITLNDLSPVVTHFADRPMEILGVMNPQLFLNSIGFTREDPPKAAIMLANPFSNDEDMIIADLINPTYDEQSNSVLFHIHVEGIDDHGHEHGAGSNSISASNGDPGYGDEHGADPFHHLRSRQDDSLPAQFGEVVLFIHNDGCVGC